MYSHYAICVGDGKIIHRTDAGFDPAAWVPAISSPSGVESHKAKIRRDPLLNPIFADYGYEIDNMHDSKYSPLSPQKIVQEAETLLGELGYNIFSKNCEHFVTWCRYGKNIRCQQITRTLQKVGDIIVEAGKTVVLGTARCVY
ncbi:phospholipase A and acyltransferase 2-like isoform X2 [Littorina saxatilis]